MLLVRRILLFLVFLLSCVGPLSADDSMSVPVHFMEDSLVYGQRIYRDGILPSGDPVRAFVMGDIPVNGTMFSCESCHRRSGLGSIEGNIIVPPVNGRMLYKPERMWDSWTRHSDQESDSPAARQAPDYLLGKDIRPAYTDASLARLLRTGIDPSGKMIDSAMPAYELNDSDMTLLIGYLKSISSAYSPGVTESTIRFATVISEGVNPVDREAMLSVLKVIIRDRNAQTRNQAKRARQGAFIKRETDTGYRMLSLDVWELKDPRETWDRQLEEHYKREPVFAILGGIADGSWKPIHEFSEKNNVPCLFPVTDLPVISSTGWNTLYFSRGFYQEGEGAARFLRRAGEVSSDTRVVQVFRDGTEGAEIARGFKETWEKLGRLTPTRKVIGKGEIITKEFWSDLIQPQGQTVILFWTGKKDVAAIDYLGKIPRKPAYVFLSSSLIEEYISFIPYRTRNFVYITYPYSLPGEKEKNIAILRTWLNIKKIPATNINILSKMYFLGWMLPEALMKMGNEFYRDYFLETFEMMDDQTNSIAVYPRLSFGLGQRFISKGCYIVQLSKSRKPSLIKKSEWVIH